MMNGSCLDYEMLELWLEPPKHTHGLKMLVNGGNKAFRKFNFTSLYFLLVCNYLYCSPWPQRKQTIRCQH